MCKDRQAKKYRLEKLNEIEKLFLASLLPMVSSGFIGIKELGRLIQTNKATNDAVAKNQAIWATVYNQMLQRYRMVNVIPKQILENKGHRWVVRLLSPKKRVPGPPPHHPLPNPSHDENNLVLFGNLSYNRGHQNTNVGFSITGEELKPLLIDGRVYIGFGNGPLPMEDAVIERTYRDKDGYRARISLAGLHPETIRLRVQLLRLGCMKTCCVYEPNSIEAVCENSPSLRSLRALVEPRTLDDLDFDNGLCSGWIGLEKPPWAERLSLQDSPQANRIRARFPYSVSFRAEVEISVHCRKTVISGVFFYATKTPMESMQVSYDFYSEHERWDHHNNHGVTVAHILSELYCPDDSEETHN